MATDKGRDTRFQPRERVYRAHCNLENAVRFEVRIEESDLLVLADRDLRNQAREELALQRGILKRYIRDHPEFYRSFSPVAAERPDEILQMMSRSSFLTATGPMASVAGALAELVGRRLLRDSSRLIVENGGDIFLRLPGECVVGIYAGSSPLSLRLGIRVPGSPLPRGIATSSGTVGHSHSFGRADAVTVLSPSATLADGAATHMANLIHTPDDFRAIPDKVRDFPFIEGIVVILGKELFAWGTVELVSL